MLAFAFVKSELLPNELVGSALSILDVIRCFYVLDLALSFGSPLLIVPRTNVGVPVRRRILLLVAGLTHDKNLDLKSGETTR